MTESGLRIKGSSVSWPGVAAVFVAAVVIRLSIALYGEVPIAGADGLALVVSAGVLAGAAVPPILIGRANRGSRSRRFHPILLLWLLPALSSWAFVFVMRAPDAFPVQKAGVQGLVIVAAALWGSVSLAFPVASFGWWLSRKRSTAIKVAVVTLGVILIALWAIVGMFVVVCAVEC